MGGFTRNVAAPEGKVNITINSDEDGPLEVFINVGRAGSDVAALAEALGRLISLQLRLPSTMSQEERLRQVANQLRGIGGSRSIGFGRDRVLSLPDAVAQAIYRHLEEHPTPPRHASTVPAAQLALPVADPPAAPPAPVSAADGYARAGSTPPPTAVLTGNLCPQCGSSSAFVREEGCRTCHNCGYSEC
jgi:ribonucleoside-diphosphate reductase alpha chain